MKPKLILDPKFVYVPAIKTDVRKTFERIRREQEQAKQDRVVREFKRG